MLLYSKIPPEVLMMKHPINTQEHVVIHHIPTPACIAQGTHADD